MADGSHCRHPWITLPLVHRSPDINVTLKQSTELGAVVFRVPPPEAIPTTQLGVMLAALLCHTPGQRVALIGCSALQVKSLLAGTKIHLSTSHVAFLHETTQIRVRSLAAPHVHSSARWYRSATALQEDFADSIWYWEESGNNTLYWNGSEKATISSSASSDGDDAYFEHQLKWAQQQSLEEAKQRMTAQVDIGGPENEVEETFCLERADSHPSPSTVAAQLDACEQRHEVYRKDPECMAHCMTSQPCVWDDEEPVVHTTVTSSKSDLFSEPTLAHHESCFRKLMQRVRQAAYRCVQQGRGDLSLATQLSLTWNVLQRSQALRLQWNEQDHPLHVQCVYHLLGRELSSALSCFSSSSSSMSSMSSDLPELEALVEDDDVPALFD